MTPQGANRNVGRRVNARSSGSNQVPESPLMEYEEDEVYSLRSECALDTHGMVLLNLRKSMAEQVRQKLTEKVTASFEGFLDIRQISQDDNGKVVSLECDMKADRLSSRPPYRLIIGCEADDTFLIFQDTSADGSKPTSAEFDLWLEIVSSFGLSGRCTSLSALFQFAYDHWRCLGHAAPVLSQPLTLSGAIAKAGEDLELNRPHSAIDTLSALIRSNLTDNLTEALTLRCRAYAQAGMYSLAIDETMHISRINGGFVPAEALVWKGVSLQGLQRSQEAVQAYLDSLEIDPMQQEAREKLSDLLRSGLLTNAEVAQNVVRGEQHPRRHARRERLDSVPDSGTTGTTASRWSSRSTTPTSCASGDLQEQLL
jgi:tetratricopeptide (TPR) repeat protein